MTLVALTGTASAKDDDPEVSSSPADLVRRNGALPGAFVVDDTSIRLGLLAEGLQSCFCFWNAPPTNAHDVGGDDGVDRQLLPEWVALALAGVDRGSEVEELGVRPQLLS